MLLTYLFAIFIALLVSVIVKFIRTRREYNELSKSFGCAKRHWLFGHGLLFLGSAAEIFARFNEFITTNGPNVILWGIGNYIEFVTTNPKDIELLLTSKLQTKKATGYEYLKDWLGSGLLTTFGEPWFQMRRILTPTFHFKIVERFVDVFNEQNKVLVQVLKDSIPSGEKINISDLLTRCTLDNICETAMGVKIDALLNPNQEYITAVKKMSEIIFNRMFGMLNQFPLIFNLTPAAFRQRKALKVLHNFTNDVIRKRKINFLEEDSMKDDSNTTQSNKKARLSFLNLLLDIQQQDKNLTDLQIRQEVDTFMFAGHDTTTSASTFAVYELAMNPGVQEKIFNEQINILGGDLMKTLTFNDLKQMNYLDLVIKEVLRMHPPVPFIGRQTIEPVKLNGVQIPSNVDVTIPIYTIHHDPKIFKDPNTFNPDRFAADEIDWNPLQYLPFSAGNRNCIGQRFALLELKSIISALVRNFKIYPVDELKDIVVYSDLVLRIKGGLSVRLEVRDQINE